MLFRSNKKIENYFKRIDKEVPLENRVEADASISFPVLQHLALCEEKTIFNEMFFNILKSSVERNKKEFISPAFFELLKQLTRDEALMLMLLKNKSYKYHTYMDLDKTKNIFYNRRVILNEFGDCKLEYPNKIMLYNEHLSSLGLCNCLGYKQEEPIFSENIIEIGSGAFSQKAKEQIGIKSFYEFNLTEFGKEFASICVSEKCYEYI